MKLLIKLMRAAGLNDVQNLSVIRIDAVYTQGQVHARELAIANTLCPKTRSLVNINITLILTLAKHFTATENNPHARTPLSLSEALHCFFLANTG